MAPVGDVAAPPSAAALSPPMAFAAAAKLPTLPSSSPSPSPRRRTRATLPPLAMAPNHFVRKRHHVNPLGMQYQRPLELPEHWLESAFDEPARPFHVDIGCARGRFLLEMARAHPERNYLGLEIREPLIAQARRQREGDGLRNLEYLFCNVNVHAETIFTALPSRSITDVSVQFPDPWFKKRHQKRRCVQPPLVASLARFQPPGAALYVASDVRDVAEDMTAVIDDSGYYTAVSGRVDDENGALLLGSPYGIATERERQCVANELLVYRRLYRRRS